MTILRISPLLGMNVAFFFICHVSSPSHWTRIGGNGYPVQCPREEPPDSMPFDNHHRAAGGDEKGFLKGLQGSPSFRKGKKYDVKLPIFNCHIYMAMDIYITTHTQFLPVSEI